MSDATLGPEPNLGAYGTPAVSADGRFVAYAAQRDSASGPAEHVVLRRDNLARQTVRIDVATDGSPADGPSLDSAISGDGRVVAFTSTAANLVPGVDDNDSSDVFVRDVQLGTTARVSVSTAGEQADMDSYAPSISANGRYVAFTSDSDELVDGDWNGSPDVFVHDRQTHTTMLVSISTEGFPSDFGAWDGVISADGLHVAFTTDTDWVTADQNGGYDVYVRDLGSIPRTRRISTTTTSIDGGEMPAISADGSLVAYIADSGDVYQRQGSVVRRVNAGVAPGDAPAAGPPAMSADGRWVAFTSFGDPTGGADTNGVKPDVFIRDMLSGITTIGSTTSTYAQLNADSVNAGISADGHYVFWISPGAFDQLDTNGINDVYLRALPVPQIMSVTPSVVTRGTTVNITVNGKAFLGPTMTGLVDQGGKGVVVNSTTWVNETTANVNITVAPTAAVGFQKVQLFNPGTGIGLGSGAGGECANCLSVQ